MVKQKAIIDQFAEHLKVTANEFILSEKSSTIFDLLKYVAYLESNDVEPLEDIISILDIKRLISNTRKANLKADNGYDIFEK